MDLNLDDPIILNPSILYDSIVVHSDIIHETDTLPTTLLQINVELNPEIINKLDFMLMVMLISKELYQQVNQ